MPTHDLILLVEDNPDDVKLTLRSFAKHQIGNELVVARDGAEALDFLFARGAFAGRDPSVVPSLILLDLKLPRVGGLQVLTQLRADPRTKHVPVVILTSSSEEHDMTRSYSGGANIFVRKPIDLTGLLTAASSLGLYWTLLSSGLTLLHRERGAIRAAPAAPGATPTLAEAEDRVAEVVVGIEDDELCGRITNGLRVDGHRVRQGKTARDAFRLLYALLPDILVVDNQLSDINGIEIVRALRETPQGRTVTPVLLTADTAEAMADLRDARVHVLGTPVSIVKLATLVRGIWAGRLSDRS